MFKSDQMRCDHQYPLPTPKTRYILYLRKVNFSRLTQNGQRRRNIWRATVYVNCDLKWGILWDMFRDQLASLSMYVNKRIDNESTQSFKCGKSPNN